MSTFATLPCSEFRGGGIFFCGGKGNRFSTFCSPPATIQEELYGPLHLGKNVRWAGHRCNRKAIASYV